MEAPEITTAGAETLVEPAAESTDALIEAMFVTCLEAEFWIAADLWLGAGVRCSHGSWRAEAAELSFHEALAKLHPQFMAADHDS